MAVPRARHGGHRAGAGDIVRRADRASDPAARPGDPPDGYRRLHHKIEVNGPQDLRYLGQRLEWLRARLHELEEQQNRFLRQCRTSSRRRSPRCAKEPSSCATTSGASCRPEQREIVRIVRQNTLSLQKLIEDLLTYHQTRAMEPQTVGPGLAWPTSCARVLGEHKLAAFARMVTFEQQLGPRWWSATRTRSARSSTISCRTRSSIRRARRRSSWRSASRGASRCST